MSGASAAAAAAAGVPVGKFIQWQTTDVPAGARARGTFELNLDTKPNPTPLTYYVVCNENEIVTISLKKDEDRVVPSTTALTTRKVHLQEIGLTNDELVFHNPAWKKGTPEEENLHLYAAFFDKMTGTQILRWLNALKDLTERPADQIIADIKAVYPADKDSGKAEN